MQNSTLSAQLTTNKVGAATANREFTQNQTPLAKHFYRIHTGNSPRTISYNSTRDSSTCIKKY